MITPTLRPRHDGWTAERQAGFIAALAAGSSVAAAAAGAGMSRRAAYRLRAHPAGAAVAAVWGGGTRVATEAEYNDAAENGLEIRRARLDTAEAAYPGGAGVWLMRQLRTGMRRDRRRAAAARRVAAIRRAAAAASSAVTHEKAGRSVSLCDLSFAAGIAGQPAAAVLCGKKPVVV